MKPKILYQNADFMILNKPAGLVVHPGHNTKNTLVGYLKAEIDDPGSERPGIVHRLDKDTSGVMVVAKNPQAKSYLQGLFKSRQVEKTYLALVEGTPKNSSASIELPVGRHPKNPFKKAIRAGGRDALTTYRIVKNYSDKCLLELKPQTGRMHQIRVHLAHIGHPVVGDAVYGRGDPALSRHFLHASQLKFTDTKGKVRQFSAALPHELQAYLDKL